MSVSNTPEKTPIFVVGNMHSGTTLVQKIISAHPSIYPADHETKYYEFLPLIKKGYANLENDQVRRQLIIFTLHSVLYGTKLKDLKREQFLNEPNISEADIDALKVASKKIRQHGAILPLVFNYLAKKASKSHWLEKTPAHILHIDQIMQFIPEAYFVEIVRDPRAVLASKKARRASAWTNRYSPELQPRKNLEKAYDPLWDTLSWKSAINAGYEAHKKYPQRIITIRYEDLVTEQDDCVRKMCSFLNLIFDPRMLKVETQNTAYWSEEVLPGISSQFVRRWQSTLTPAEINIAQLLSGEEMQRLDYVHGSTSLVSKLLLPLYFVRSFFEFVQRLYRRFRMGGRIFLLNILKNYYRRGIKIITHSRN